MSAGKYRIPVLIQRPVDTRSASGAVTRSFVAVDRAFAALRFLGQSEVFDGSRTVSRKTWAIRLRPFPGLAGGWRVLVDTRTLDILSVTDPGGLGREWLCEAQEDSE